MCCDITCSISNSTATLLRQFYRLYWRFSFLSVTSLHNDTIDARMDLAIDKINGGDTMTCLLLVG